MSPNLNSKEKNTLKIKRTECHDLLNNQDPVDNKKNLTFMLLESLKEKGKKMEIKIYF